MPIGNPDPDFANEARPGANLFTNSLVALDAMTGQLKWWHQLLGPEDNNVSYGAKGDNAIVVLGIQ